MHSVGLVLHPRRDSVEAVEAVLGWASQRDITVYGIADEIVRLNCAATGVTDRELGRRSDLIVSLGGDGTMLRAMRLADGQPASVLGVNLGKLGFLAEVDVPDLPMALSAIDAQDFTVEPRLAIDSVVVGQRVTAFNDIAVVRVPGGTAAVSLQVGGQPRSRLDACPCALHDLVHPFPAIHVVYLAAISAAAFPGFSFAASNDRARCSRDRTVPTGHSMARAASS